MIIDLGKGALLDCGKMYRYTEFPLLMIHHQGHSIASPDVLDFHI